MSPRLPSLPPAPSLPPSLPSSLPVCMSLDRAIAETADYCRERKAFGKSVLDNQVVHFRLAELETEVEALRSLLYRAIGELGGVREGGRVGVGLLVREWNGDGWGMWGVCCFIFVALPPSLPSSFPPSLPPSLPPSPPLLSHLPLLPSIPPSLLPLPPSLPPSPPSLPPSLPLSLPPSRSLCEG